MSKDDEPDDLEGLNASAAHVAHLFSREPPDVKLGIGGFSMGAAAALYTATCYVLGENANRSIRYLDNLCAVVFLCGWLPCYKTMKSQMDETLIGIVQRVQSLPVFLCHGTEDDVVGYEYGQRAAYSLHSSGFRKLTFKKVHGLCHDTCDGEMLEMCSWLTDTMGLRGW